jgi:hypothetical protein
LTVPMIFGFSLMEQYVRYIGTPLFLRIGVGLVGVVAALVIMLKIRARHNLHGIQTLINFRSGLSEGVTVGFNFLIGGVLKALFILVVGLFPYASNPWILVIYAIYGMFLVAVILMRRLSTKIIAINRTRLPRGTRGVWT